ncbi:MAG: M23 family metallopeptidase [Gammaproteobacteria bacterium]|jgi:murein DD-endopeptidase MepM/ murein hydrolase activator NlpD|nr:M23 family metallopeptidase [Gammaproteobacteria bacterium]
MDILIFSKASVKRRAFRLGPFGLSALCLGFLLASGLLFYAGMQYGGQQTSNYLASVKGQANSLWYTELENQQETLNQVRQNAEKSLDAMASRLSLLQGHVMRIDALGARLADMADLEDIEFGVMNTPGMGGPAPAPGQQSMGISDLTLSLDTIEHTLNDRREKLTAMESMLIDRALQEQTLPEGRPALGGWMSSLYGYRTDPISGKKEFHQGMDFAGKLETPITAVAAGIVIWSGLRYGYGDLVEISHGNGYTTRYAHNKKNLVTVGEKIEKGEIIALMGATGRSTGVHVHFEVLRHGKHLNPNKYLSLK